MKELADEMMIVGRWSASDSKKVLAVMIETRCKSPRPTTYFTLIFDLGIGRRLMASIRLLTVTGLGWAVYGIDNALDGCWSPWDHDEVCRYLKGPK